MVWNSLFEIFPYIAVSALILGTIAMFIYDGYGITSRSSGFLENRELFWGSVPWHYGILTVLMGHFLGFIAPSAVLSFTSGYESLFWLGSFAFSMGFLSAAGIIVLLLRRLFSRYVFAVTGFFDVLILLLLLFQVFSGLYISVWEKWGMNWFASNVSVYLYSLLKFEPDGGLMSSFPLIIRLHALNFFVMLVILPFTKLIHIFTAPVKYLFRRPIIIRWNGKE